MEPVLAGLPPKSPKIFAFFSVVNGILNFFGSHPVFYPIILSGKGKGLSLTFKSFFGPAPSFKKSYDRAQTL